MNEQEGGLWLHCLMCVCVGGGGEGGWLGVKRDREQRGEGVR